MVGYTNADICWQIYTILSLHPANEVWGKVMFLHLSVILFTVATEAGGTHPTGMHTCFSSIFINLIFISLWLHFRWGLKRDGTVNLRGALFQWGDGFKTRWLTVDEPGNELPWWCPWYYRNIPFFKIKLLLSLMEIEEKMQKMTTQRTEKVVDHQTIINRIGILILKARENVRRIF